MLKRHSDETPGRGSLLMVAHPGHELRVHGWLEQARPWVCVWTDGSGGRGRARIDATRRVVEQTGARRGAIFGRHGDAELYRALLARDVEPFLGLAEELAKQIEAHEVGCVVVDAAEAFNPLHDLCHAIACTAARRAEGLRAHRIRCFDFPVVGAPDACAPDRKGRRACLELSDAAFARKLAAAEGYSELEPERELALASFGAAAFRREWFRPVDAARADARPVRPPADYEMIGEQRVLQGHYAHVLRFAEHVAPVVAALRAFGGAASPA